MRVMITRNTFGGGRDLFTGDTPDLPVPEAWQLIGMGKARLLNLADEPVLKRAIREETKLALGDLKDNAPQKDQASDGVKSLEASPGVKSLSIDSIDRDTLSKSKDLTPIGPTDSEITGGTT